MAMEITGPQGKSIIIHLLNVVKLPSKSLYVYPQISAALPWAEKLLFAVCDGECRLTIDQNSENKELLSAHP